MPVRLLQGRLWTVDKWLVSSDWFANDRLFLAQLREGHRQAVRLAERLRTDGLAVQVTPMQVRARVEERGQFADEFDLLVGSLKPCAIDVKSRALRFTGPQDYPYETALVDTVAGWKQKAHRPLAIVLVSQRTTGVAVVRVSRASGWARRRRYDNVRHITDEFFEAPREDLATYEEFLKWLRSREGENARWNCDLTDR